MTEPTHRLMQRLLCKRGHGGFPRTRRPGHGDKLAGFTARQPGHGFGDPLVSQQACDAPTGFVTDDTDWSLWDLVDRVAAARGLPGPRAHLPLGLAKGLAGLSTRALGAVGLPS